MAVIGQSRQIHLLPQLRSGRRVKRGRKKKVEKIRHRLKINFWYTQNRLINQKVDILSLEMVISPPKLLGSRTWASELVSHISPSHHEIVKQSSIQKYLLFSHKNYSNHLFCG